MEHIESTSAEKRHVGFKPYLAVDNSARTNRDTMLARIANQYREGLLGAELGNEDGTRFAVISLKTYGQDAAFLSLYGPEGFTDHMEFDSAWQAQEAAIEQGLTVPVPGTLAVFYQTGKFKVDSPREFERQAYANNVANFMDIALANRRVESDLGQAALASQPSLQMNDRTGDLELSFREGSEFSEKLQEWTGVKNNSQALRRLRAMLAKKLLAFNAGPISENAQSDFLNPSESGFDQGFPVEEFEPVSEQSTGLALVVDSQADISQSSQPATSEQAHLSDSDDSENYFDCEDFDHPSQHRP